jgi:hypothetical protein
MKLYEIMQEIEGLIDSESGEILDYEKFEQLKIDRDTKIENIALWIKNLEAEAIAVTNERKSLQDREKSLGNKTDKLKEYLTFILQGNKFATGKVAISYRKSIGLNITNEETFKQLYKQFCEVEEVVKIPKKDIKEYIQKGKVFEGVELVEKQNLQIK